MIDASAVAVLLMSENRWAVPFVTAARYERAPASSPVHVSRDGVRGFPRPTREVQDARLTVSPHRVVVRGRPLLGEGGEETEMGFLFTLRRPLMQVATGATSSIRTRGTEGPRTATNHRPQAEPVRNPGADEVRPARRPTPQAAGRRWFEVSRRASSATAPSFPICTPRTCGCRRLHQPGVRGGTCRRDRGQRVGVHRHRFEVTALDVGGDQACAEWIARFTHSGPLELNDDAIEPTGSTCDDARRDGRGFEGDKICAFRQYWDEVALVEQLGLLPVEERGLSAPPDQ